MHKKISVIMPVYNAEKYLSIAIESILNQTYKNIELICVDDCSSDNSLKIIENYQKQDARIRIIKNEENSGPGISRDKGIDVATGKYVAFIDSDDFYECDALETLYRELIKHNASVIFSNWYVYANGKDLAQCPYKNIYYTPDKLTNTFFICPWGKLFCLDFLNKYNIRFGEHRISEDRLFLQKIYVHIDKIWLSNFISYHWQNNKNSITRQKSSAKNPKFFEAILVADECFEYTRKFRPEIFNADAEMERILDWCYRIHYPYLKNFFFKISELCKKWNLSRDMFEKEESWVLYSTFINNDYKKIMKAVFWKSNFMKRLIKTICIFVPRKSWRKKLRSLYGK